jgi:hypothetical protein
VRFYDITITDPTNADKKQIYTSWFNGKNDPGALNLILDAPVTTFSRPLGATMLELWGIPIQTISNANNLNNKIISVQAGFKPGLPLATQASEKQSGPIINGYILQAFGNWIGTNMTLNLVVVPGTPRQQTQTATTAGQQPATATNTTRPPLGSPTAPVDFHFNMPVGMSLRVAVENTLTTALPNFTRQIRISTLLSPGPRNFVSRSLSEFAQTIKTLSRQLNSDIEYPGVDITLTPNNTLLVSDGTEEVKRIDISYLDLIGQPTWIEPLKIQFKCPMRADLQVGYNITLPKGRFYGIQPSDPNLPRDYRFQSAQQGTFRIIELRHVGNFRQPDANSWVTVVTCAFRRQV